MKEVTNENLMIKVAEGDLDVLKILFERHHQHVFNFLYKMCGDKMLSEDLTQDVFYKVLKYRSSYNRGSFVSWLFTIARNSMHTYFRRDAKNHDDIAHVTHKLMAEEKDRSEEYSHLQKALAKLDTGDRELIVLNRFQEIKYNEIAEIVGSTPGAIKTRVSRALRKLKVIYFDML